VSTPSSRKIVYLYLLLLVPIAWLATLFEPFQIDGDAVSYMDIADLIRAHHWPGIVNGYWHPLYPACLAIAQILFHPTRWNELAAYEFINYIIFFAQAAAILLFVSALVRLRERMNPQQLQPLLSLDGMRLLGLGLLVIASQRELSMGKVRPDALLSALLITAFAMLMESLAAEKFSRAAFFFAPLMGAAFGLAYLTKSFAFVIAFLAFILLFAFQHWLRRRTLWQSAVTGALAFLAFAIVAGPYIAALSMQKHRFDYGDSGALNYAWYCSGTEKFHLEPWMTDKYGASSVHLIHPELQLLASPGVYSYRAESFGTYPAWFDPTYFNERVVPHLDLHQEIPRVLRNIVLFVHYLTDHPEGWVLLLLLISFGARFGFKKIHGESFWLSPFLLGLAIIAIYALVNIEERYIAAAWYAMLLPACAALCIPAALQLDEHRRKTLQQIAFATVALLAFIFLAESLRIAIEERRVDSVNLLPHSWYDPQTYGAARGLAALGVKPGDEVACVGSYACVHNHYWARLAGVRALTEINQPFEDNLVAHLQNIPNRQQAYDVVKAQGAKVLVGKFDPGSMNEKIPAASGWLRLGDTDFYALPLNLPANAAQEK